MVKIGEYAPSFTLPDKDLKQISIEGFRGRKVLLAFFPGAFTSVCTREMCTFRDSLQNFAGFNAQVVAVSVNDPFTLRGFAEKNSLTFPLLSDYSRRVIELYGVVLNDFAGLKGYSAGKRSVFILDRSGVVRYRWVSDDPAKEPNYDEISMTLEQIK